jgi:hypothetical protein
MIYETGTSHSSGFTLADIGGSLGIASSSSTMQSQFAARVAPPPKRSTGSATVCLVIALIVASVCLPLWLARMNEFNPDKGELRLFEILGGAGCLVIVWSSVSIWKANAYNREKWPAFYETWQQRFACLKCGKIWIPVEDAFDGVPERAATPKVFPCPDCGGKASRRAEQCPHCGCPLSRAE